LETCAGYYDLMGFDGCGDDDGVGLKGCYLLQRVLMGFFYLRFCLGTVLDVILLGGLHQRGLNSSNIYERVRETRRMWGVVRATYCLGL
jgi:hypothetical protein